MAKLKEDILMDVRPRDLLKKLSLQDQKVELDIQVPDNFYQTMLEQLLERDYLNYTSEKIFQPESASGRKRSTGFRSPGCPSIPTKTRATICSHAGRAFCPACTPGITAWFSFC